LSGAGLVGAALLGGGALGGCGPEKTEGPVRLIFSHGEDTGILRRQISRFNERNRGEIEVELRLAPADTGQYFEKLKTEFQSGEANVDVISGDVIWPAEFAANGWISDLSDLFSGELREENLPATVESNTHEGSVYGVPWFTDAGMLYYRADLLEQSGISEPPATWAELKEMATQVAQENGMNAGFAFVLLNYGHHLQPAAVLCSIHREIVAPYIFYPSFGCVA
jgi:multiple sugar transport system substrate-binding protein